MLNCNNDYESIYYGISEFQVYLFNQSTNYESYKFLGSHYINIDGVSGFRFAVWAPKAKAVSVVGDFNFWNNKKFCLKPIKDSGVWVGFFENIPSNSLYKYAITGQDNKTTLKADPYAIVSELRPGTASVAVKDSNYKWSDKAWIAKRGANIHNAPMNIYELHLGSWKTHEDGSFYTYEELAGELVPYIKDMGYTHVEIMPIMEYPFDGSWGYQVTGYFSATSRYGSIDGLKSLINECHKNKIGVIMDWVPAHFPRDEHGLRFFDGSPTYEYADPKMGEHKDWGTMVFDYSKGEVVSFLTSSAYFWASEYHIDGIRVDAVSSMLYRNYSRNDGEWIANKYGGSENLEAIDFFKNLNDIMHKEHPGFLMIAEESTAWPYVTKPTADGGLGFDFKWNMGWMNDTLRYVALDPLFRSGNHNLLTFLMLYAYSEHYILPFSHDEVVHGKKSMIDKMFGDYQEKFDSYRALLAYYMALPGKKLMFMGGEFAQFIEWRFAEGLEWKLIEFDNHRNLQGFVKSLNNMYRNNSAFWELDDYQEGFKWINANDADKSIVSFIRKGKQDKDYTIVVVNFTPIDRSNYIIGVPEAGKYEVIMNSSVDDDVSSIYEALPNSFLDYPNSLSINITGNTAIYLKRKIIHRKVTNK